MLTLLLALSAHADVPPRVGYVEQCTVAKHSAGGRECVTCEGYHGGREPCETLERQGYERVCQTSGASVWTEVMCKGQGTPPPIEPVVVDPVKPEPVVIAPAKTAKCSHLPLGSLAPGLFVLLLPLLRRRRV